MLEMNRSVEESGLLNLKFSGDITIQEAQVLRQELMAALQESKKGVCLDLSKAQEVDLTGFQVFCAAHKTAMAENKQLILADKMPDTIQNLIKSAGLERVRGCSTSDDPSGCLWVRGGSLC